jgi:hypothetical protein
MKRTILFLAVALMTTTTVFAQKKFSAKTNKISASPNTAAKANLSKAAQVKEAGASLKFSNEEHNFGTVPEGPSVSYDFEFKNTTSEPVQLESVRASCGCTTPNWSKEPILPGKSSKITATYNTKGRPGSFYKTITVKSTAGQKVLKIKGTVEKAPSSSVPTNNNSMIKH